MSLSRIRVMLADDHPVVSDGISARLEKDLMIDIVGVAASFAEVLALLRTTPTDVLVLDLSGMQGSPLVTVANIRHHYPSIAIVVFSSATSQAPDLLQAGVLGFVVKEDMVLHLAQAIHSAYRRQRYCSPTVTQYLERDSLTKLSLLAPKQRDVLELLAQGYTTLEIAKHMGIDPRSAQNYITSMNRKIGGNSRHQLIEWYRRVSEREEL